jgi:hypothetical protein
MSVRPPGTLSGPVTALAAIMLVGATGIAISMLPAKAGEGWGAPSAAPQPQDAANELTGVRRRLVMSLPPQSPRGFVAFVDTARTPRFDPSDEIRRTGVRFYTLGRLTAGADGCTPRWHGMRPQGVGPVANRLGGLRGAGGDAGLAFGGAGRELSTTCTDQDRLAAAYRRVLGAFDPSHIDFEVAGGSDLSATLRRAKAIRALKKRTPGLEVFISVPLSPTGLAEGDQRMLRATIEAGAVIDTINLLVPLRPAAGDRRALGRAIRAARAQVGTALGVPDEQVWRHVALTTVLTGPGDLDQARAGRLMSFAARNGLAWISTRGARPADAVLEILSSSRA